MLSLRSNLREALKRSKVRFIPPSLKRYEINRLSDDQDTIGYNLAALRYISRQYEASKTAEFYEQDGGMIEEDKVREKIDEGIKKRKRAVLKS